MKSVSESNCVSSIATTRQTRRQLFKRKSLAAYPHIAAYIHAGSDGKPVEVSATRSIDLTDVHLETAAGEVVPDVIATIPNGRWLFIEIANTPPLPDPEGREA
jgi:hypothetical protein